MRTVSALWHHMMFMNIESEDLPLMEHVTEADVKRVFQEAFGKFIILTGDDGGFIQAADAWEIDDGAADPFVLEYRDAASGKQYASTKLVTLLNVEAAFISYLRGELDWREGHEWKELAL